MNEEITVDEAMSKGRKLLVWYPMFALIGCVLVGICGVNLHILPPWCFFVFLILAFILSWLVWSYNVTKWKIWAYPRVKSLTELKVRAISARMIWADGSLFERTEIKSREQAALLKELNKRAVPGDSSEDNNSEKLPFDSSAPPELIISYSRRTLLFLLAIYLIILAIGIYALSDKDEYRGLLLSVFGVYLLFGVIKKLSTSSSLATISASGIAMGNDEIIRWDKIHDERVYSSAGYRNVTWHLFFKYLNQGGVEMEKDINLSYTNTDTNKLGYYLTYYRQRFNEKR